jgi:hypothetical protein
MVNSDDWCKWITCIGIVAVVIIVSLILVKSLKCKETFKQESCSEVSSDMSKMIEAVLWFMPNRPKLLGGITRQDCSKYAKCATELWFKNLSTPHIYSAVGLMISTYRSSLIKANLQHLIAKYETAIPASPACKLPWLVGLSMWPFN